MFGTGVTFSGIHRINEENRENEFIERLYYDYCNNGNMNCLEYEEEDCPQCDGIGWEDEEAEIDCYNCEGSCYVDGEIYITDFYKGFINFLLEFGDENVKHQTYKLQDWMLGHGLKGDFRDENFKQENLSYPNIHIHFFLPGSIRTSSMYSGVYTGLLEKSFRALGSYWI